MTMHANHRGQFVTPTKTLALMDTLGASRAARAIGVSTTLLYTARKENEVSKVVEVAAEGALNGTVGVTLAPKATVAPTKPAAETPPAVRVVLLEVAENKLPMVQKLAKSLGAPILVD